MHEAHLLLLTLVAGLPATTSALACDRRSLLHLARFGAPLHKIQLGQSGGPKVARRNQGWPIWCQQVPILQVHQDRLFIRYKTPNMSECSGVTICRKSEKSARSERGGKFKEGRTPPLIGCPLQRNSAIADSSPILRHNYGLHASGRMYTKSG